jgi:hypothetical protein
MTSDAISDMDMIDAVETILKAMPIGGLYVTITDLPHRYIAQRISPNRWRLLLEWNEAWLITGNSRLVAARAVYESSTEHLVRSNRPGGEMK